MSYGIIFWGNSYHCNIIFKIQKRIIRIMANKGRHESCRNLFKQFQILTQTSQYIFSLLVFVAKHRNLYMANSEIHDMNTRFNYNLHLPSTRLSLVQKGVLYSGSRIPNQLPLYINPYPTAFPYGNGMVLHFYQQQESSTTKTVHKVINKGLKTYV